jgi:hypothetical protein
MYSTVLVHTSASIWEGIKCVPSAPVPRLEALPWIDLQHAPVVEGPVVHTDVAGIHVDRQAMSCLAVPSS